MAEKTVKVLGKTITVHTATTRMAISRTLLAEESAEKYKDQPIEFKILAVELYPKLVACSVCEGEFPTPEELIDAEEKELNKWADTVADLNPHWFPGVEQLNETQRQKKGS